MYSVTKRIDFCYGHRLLDYAGICKHPHGHNGQVEIAYRSDPLNVHSTTTRLGMELFREQARVQSRLTRIGALPVPTYVLHGGDDPVVPVSSSASLARRENVTRRVYPQLRHEMHNEPEADAVIGDTIAWIETALR